MGTYNIGDGATADYADFVDAEADLSLPEVGGTTYKITGTTTTGHSFSNANYINGLIVTALEGEEADGARGGATLAVGNLTTDVEGAAFSNFNTNRVITVSTTSTETTFDNMDVGNDTTAGVDLIAFTSASLATFTNCIIRDGSDDNVYSTAQAAGMYFIRCTSVDAARMGFIRCDCVDCLAIGNGTDFFSGVTGDYLASSDSTATTEADTTGYNNRTTADLNNYAAGNYNLNSGSSLRTSGSTGGIIGADIALGEHPLTGVATSPLVGSVYTGGVQLSGVSSTPAIGNVTVPASAESANLWKNALWYQSPWKGSIWYGSSSSDVAITGVGTTPDVGSVSFTESGSVGLTGVSATFDTGNVLAPTWLTGVTTTTAIGIVTPVVENNVTTAITGNSVTINVGTLIAAIDGSVYIPITTVSATTSVGDVAFTESGIVELTGASSTVSVDSFGVSIGLPRTIDGERALVIATNYQSKTLYCNTNYFTID